MAGLACLGAIPGAARAAAPCDQDSIISGGAIFICCCRVAAPGRSRSAQDLLTLFSPQ